MQETVEQILAQAIQAWRWRWLGVIASWFVAVAGAFYVTTLPDVYESEARIRIDADSALRPLMKGLAVNSDMRDQVRIMEQTLLSRPNLEKVARTVDLDVTVNNVAQEQAMLESLKGRIKMRSVGGQIFGVSYRDTNPVRAREVVQALLTIFIEANLGENREDMAQAELFLASQLKAYEGQLISIEEKQARFRAENLNILSSSGRYVDRIEAGQSAVVAATQSLDEVKVMAATLAARLGATPQYLSPGDSVSALERNSQISSTYSRIQSIQQTLDELLLQYTESHPDVIALKQRRELLVEQYNRERSGESAPIDIGPRVLNPVYEQIAIRLIDARAEVNRLEQRKVTAEEALVNLREKASIAPGVEAEMAALNRDYGTLKIQYESLLGRLESARLSRAMETSTDSIQFRTVDPPQVPAEPSGPPRTTFLFGVLFMAFGAGGGVAFVRSQLADTFAIPAGLSDAFHIPVIGTVSRVSDLAVRARGFIGNLTFFAAAAIPVVVVLGTMMLMPYTSGFREMIELSPLGSFL